MDSASSQIRPGMDVLDLAGVKIGTVSRIHGDPAANFGQGGAGPGRDMEAKRAGKGAGGHIEVERGGHDLMIPFSAVNEVRDDAVYIIVEAAAVESQNWDRVP
jgi:hypothetical protein